MINFKIIDTGGIILPQQFYKSLSLIQEMFPISNVELETFNQKYEAFNFNLKDLSFKSRLTKKTPLKQGYFVVFLAKK
nr:MepB family protein [Liquorilactobacillus satsumensis]